MIKLTYKDKTYSLKYTRESVKQMESTGFNINELEKKPMTMIPAMFYGAFLALNRGVKRDLVDEIWKEIPNKNDMINALAEMYAETVTSLIDDNTEGNVVWEVE